MVNTSEGMIRSYMLGIQTRRERERRAEEMEDREYEHKLKELKLKGEKLQLEMAKRKAAIEQAGFWETIPQRFAAQGPPQEQARQPQGVPQGAPQSVQSILAGRTMAGAQSERVQEKVPHPTINIPGLPSLGITEEIPYQTRPREQAQAEALDLLYAQARAKELATAIEVPGVGPMPKEMFDAYARAQEGEANRQSRERIAERAQAAADERARMDDIRARDIAEYTQAQANYRAQLGEAGRTARSEAEQQQINARSEQNALAQVNAARAQFGDPPLKHLPGKPGYEIELRKQQKGTAGVRRIGYGQPVTTEVLEQYKAQILASGEAADEASARRLAVEQVIEDGWDIRAQNQ